MKLRPSVLFLLALLAFSHVYAQQKMLTIEDAVLRGRTALAPERLEQLQWIPATNKFIYISKNNGQEELTIYNADSRQKETILSLPDWLANVKGNHPGIETLKRFPAFTVQKNGSLRYAYKGSYFSYNLQDRTVSLLHGFPSAAASQEYSEASGYTAYTIDNNLHISTGNGKTVAVSDENNKGIVYGQAAHRNEFGITKGTFWSTDGKKLAFYRMDESMVTDYPIYDLEKRPAMPEEIRYPVAGAASHHVTVGVYDVATGNTVYLKTGEPAEQYLTNITWSPDGKYIYIAIVNREQNHLWLNQYEVSDGRFVKTLFEETHAKYVEPEHTLIFPGNDPGKFLWFSERNGYNHLYLYDSKGKMLKQVTSGERAVMDYHGTDAKGKNIFVTLTARNGMDREIYSAELSSGKMKLISSSEQGMHSGLFSETGKYFIDQFSNASTPRITSLHETGGKLVNTLLVSKNPVSEYNIGRHEFFTLKRAGLPDLNTRTIYPPGFDASKKYPVLVYLYGGPHLQLVTNSWLYGADMWLEYMAQQGYIVFTLDNRGSANRGLEFENAIYRRVGTCEMEDQLAGVNYLKTKSYVDADRMGVYGWSFGGFMTTSLMTRNAGVFKAAVAGGPVIDWGLYEIMYGERYMDTPQENPDGYNNNNLVNHAQNLKGKLLMIHCTSDNVVLWQHSLLFVKKCVEKGVLLDYFVYPGHEHNVLGPDRVHLMKKITGYFKDNL